MIEFVLDTPGTTQLAIVLRAAFILDCTAGTAGAHFPTPHTYSQQLGYMYRPRGHVIRPHRHNPVARTIHQTQEVVFVKAGCVCVRLYDEAGAYVTSRTLREGDWILLAAGGHGFEFIVDSELIEVKQGPYSGTDDKTYIEEKPF